MACLLRNVPSRSCTPHLQARLWRFIVWKQTDRWPVFLQVAFFTYNNVHHNIIGGGLTKMNKKKTGWKHKLFLEMTAYWINVVYLTISFAVFTSYRRLILAHYDITYSNRGISLIKALVLAKVIMVGSLFHFGRRLENKPLIFLTLSKSVMFTLWVALLSSRPYADFSTGRARLEHRITFWAKARMNFSPSVWLCLSLLYPPLPSRN